jgi:transposase
MSLPGIGIIMTAEFLAEADYLSRFPRLAGVETRA